METLGPYLRSAREAKGIDLRDAAQQTRISINFLKAIEKEDFSKLPGEVFVKGFLKSYARFLQLSEDDVMDRYAECIRTAASATTQKSDRSKAPTPAPAPQAKQAASPPEQTKQRSWEPYLWGGIAVIALAALVLIVVPERHPAKGPSRSPSSRPTDTALVTVPATTAMPEKLYLEIVALDDVWVLVRTDSSPQKKAVLNKGESITWSADARFLVSYGSIGAAKLILNGKELTVTGPKNAVVRDMIITAAGVAYQKFDAEKPAQAKQKMVTRPAVTPPPIRQAPTGTISPPRTAPTASPQAAVPGPAPSASSTVLSILSRGQ